jgi:hypothetical protein
MVSLRWPALGEAATANTGKAFPFENEIEM